MDTPHQTARDALLAAQARRTHRRATGLAMRGLNTANVLAGAQAERGEPTPPTEAALEQPPQPRPQQHHSHPHTAATATRKHDRKPRKST